MFIGNTLLFYSAQKRIVDKALLYLNKKISKDKLTIFIRADYKNLYPDYLTLLYNNSFFKVSSLLNYKFNKFDNIILILNNDNLKTYLKLVIFLCLFNKNVFVFSENKGFIKICFSDLLAGARNTLFKTNTFYKFYIKTKLLFLPEQNKCAEKKICILLKVDFFLDTRVQRIASIFEELGYKIIIYMPIDILSDYERAFPEKQTQYKNYIIKYISHSLFPAYFRNDIFNNTVIDVLKEVPEIVLAHDFECLEEAYIIKELNNNIKLFYDAGEVYSELHPLSSAEKEKAEADENRFLKKVDIFTCANDGFGDCLYKKYNKKPYIFLDVSEETIIKPETGFSGKLLFCGFIHSSRKLEYLLDILYYLPENFTLTFIGLVRPDNYQILLDNKIKKLCLNKRVKILPFVDAEKRIENMSKFDVGIFMLPFDNVYNYTVPNKYFEYLAAGVPVAVNSDAFISDEIKKYNIGIGFDRNNPEKAATEFKKFMDEGFYKSCCKNIHKILKEKYDWDKIKQDFKFMITDTF